MNAIERESYVVDPYGSGVDPFDRSNEQVMLANVRALQPIPPFRLEPADFRNQLVQGKQPPPIPEILGSKQVFEGKQPLDDVKWKENATQPVYLPFRDSEYGVALPQANGNFKTWPLFESGYGRTALSNENCLFAHPEKESNNIPFMGEVPILDKHLRNVFTKTAYTDEELREIFGKPTVFQEGTFAWYAYQHSGVNYDQRVYFVYDRQLQKWIPRYYNGSRVFPLEWSSERLGVNLPPAIKLPTAGQMQGIPMYTGQLTPQLPIRGELKMLKASYQ
jgi:hypothetical protein